VGEHTPDASQWTMRETKHVNGGKDWFGYEHQCVEQPRLRRFDRYERKSRLVKSTWRVDGEDRASFDDALEALESTPALTGVEMETLALFRAESMAKSEFGDFQTAYPVLRVLDAKGLVWWENGRVRLLPDAALAAIGTTESNASGTPAWEYVSARVDAARAVIAKARGAS
jgi:hypothetical protein